jgi:hypothetical protein
LKARLVIGGIGRDAGDGEELEKPLACGRASLGKTVEHTLERAFWRA